MIPGEGVPTGGLTGQVLTKSSPVDYDTEWASGATQSWVNAQLANYALAAHDHDEFYYTKAEVDAAIAAVGGEVGPHDHDADYAAIDHDHAGVYAPVAHDHDADYYSAAAGAALEAALVLQSADEWTINVNDEATVYIAAVEAMTINAGNAAIGVGTVAYEKSTTAAPDTFSAASLPVVLEAGAWLKIAVTAVTDFKAIHLVRTA